MEQNWTLQIICFVLLLPFAVWFTFLNSFYNWDLLAYAAVVLQYNGTTPEEIHQLVYSWANSDLPQQARELVLTGEQYNIRCAENPDFFLGQLGFYKVKPLFTGLIWLFYKIGIPLRYSLQLPSFLSFLFIGNMMLRWLYRETNKIPALAGAVMFTIALCSQVASIISPDALASLLVVCFFYSYYYGKHWLIQAALMVLLIATRIDFAVLACFFLVVVGLLYWRNQKISVGYLAALLFAIALLGLFIPFLSGNKMFWFLEYRFTDSIAGYARQLAVGFRQVLTTKLILIAGLLLFVLPVRQAKWRTILLTIGAAIMIRGLLFPVMQDRFFVGYYLVTIVCIVCYKFGNQQKIKYRI